MCDWGSSNLDVFLQRRSLKDEHILPRRQRQFCLAAVSPLPFSLVVGAVRNKGVQIRRDEVMHSANSRVRVARIEHVSRRGANVGGRLEAESPPTMQVTRSVFH